MTNCFSLKFQSMGSDRCIGLWNYCYNQHKEYLYPSKPCCASKLTVLKQNSE